MKTYTITLYVERNDEELELEVSGTVSEYVPAKLSGHPDTQYPSEGGEVEITSVKLNGADWNGELTKDERERAEQGLTDVAAYDDSDFRDDYDLDDYLDEKEGFDFRYEKDGSYFDDDIEVIDYPDNEF